MVDVLFALTELCTARLFSKGVDSLHSSFTRTGSSPINHSWHQKTRDTGLPDGEYCVLLCSLVLTQYWSVMDRWTDRRADMP